jgi:hypothetical protein
MMTRSPAIALSLLCLSAWSSFTGAPPGLVAAPPPSITSVRLPRRDLERFSVLEAEITLAGAFKNPFDPDEVKVDAHIAAPEGKSIVVPAFFESSGPRSSRWLARYAPDGIGEHSLEVRVIRKGSDEKSKAFAFKVRPSKADGFLRVDPDSSHFFRHDSQKPFRGIGINMGWEVKETGSVQKYTYDFLFPELKKRGCNLVRTWMCPWNLPLEWKKVAPGKYRDDDQTYNRSAVKRLDELLALAERHGIYLILTLDYHGALKTKPDDWGGNNHWSSHPYNRSNGGPCERPIDFFTHGEARRLYRNRLRYLVARWSHSPRICAWELWNEVDHVMEETKIPPEVIVEWHREMARYLREIDPHRHLVTTSVSHVELPGLFEIEAIDFSQTHLYGKTDGFPGRIRDLERKHKKPHVVGEFAFDWKSPQGQDPAAFETELHLGLWRGLFSPTPVLPLTWWWEHFHGRGEFSHLEHIAAFHRRILESGAPLRELSLAGGDDLEMAGLAAGDQIFVWLRNRADRDLSQVRFQVPVPQGGDDYRVVLIDPWAGRQAASLKAAAKDGRLAVTLPRLARGQDLAGVITPAS